MTDAAPRRRRLSKGRVRAVAWVAGGATFVTGIGILGAAPKPVAANASSARVPRSRPDVIVRRVVRRVILTDPATGASAGAVSGAGAGSTTLAGAGDGGAPAAPPVTTTTGGS